MSPFASAEEPAILLLEPIEPSGRLDLQGEETQRLEALSRLGRSELRVPRRCVGDFCASTSKSMHSGAGLNTPGADVR